MNYIKKYLQSNNQVHRVIKDVFNSKPVLIDHLAHRTFNITNIYKDYSKYKYQLQDEMYQFHEHNATENGGNVVVIILITLIQMSYTSIITKYEVHRGFFCQDTLA